jgi:NTP pyrophosphatase (non-canonical NTP hydrolase)
MTSLQKQAQQWREAFEVKSDNKKGSAQYNLQLNLIAEEFTEVFEAFNQLIQDDLDTHVDLLKELADLVFVCYQAAENMGWDLDETMQRVFDSNMSKLDNEGRPIRNESGKVLKGPNYQPPNLLDLVQNEQIAS